MNKTRKILLIVIAVIAALSLVVGIAMKNKNTVAPENKKAEAVIKTTHTPAKSALPKTEEEAVKTSEGGEKIIIAEETESAALSAEPQITKEPEAKATEKIDVEKEAETVLPIEPQEEKNEDIKTSKSQCTLLVHCRQVLDNIETLDKSKAGIIPAGGVIYKQKQLEFTEGESVFDILHREMKNNRIHFEFVDTPAFNSVYIEGIANLYEFDCGDCSGWMYKVNGVRPTYGCSQYKVKNGDEIEVYYSCDFTKEK